MQWHNPIQSLWASRLLIGLVLFFNLQCAFVFLIWPGEYASRFELAGIGGLAVVQGMGVLFLMWNIPYLAALLNPLRNRTSLVEALCMQTVGVAGESLLSLLLPSGHPVLFSSLQRFILFDAFGWLCLLAGLALVKQYQDHHMDQIQEKRL